MKLRIQWIFCLENIMGEKNNQWWGWGLNKEISGSFSDYLNNLKTSLRFPCFGHNPIIDSINLNILKMTCFKYLNHFEALTCFA